MVDTPITIRPYKEGDEEAINKLFNNTFNKSRTLEEWNWKFKDNPSSKDPAKWIVIAERDSKMIGHYTSLATKMKYKNTVVDAGQPVDLMTDPSARLGIKLFRDMHKLHVKFNNGIALFGFGFPNETSYLVGKKFLGYKDLGELVQLFKRLSIRSAFKRRFKQCPGWIINRFHNFSKVFLRFAIFVRGTDKGMLIKTLDAFDERINRFWNNVKDKYEIITVRNLPYLNWRYKDKQYTILIGEENGELVGYAVTKVEECGDARVGYIIDIFPSNDNKIAVLLAGILKSFIEQDVDYVLCGLLRKDPMCSQFKRLGFKEHREIKPLHVVVTTLANEIDLEYLLNQKNWHLTYGDTDGF